MSGYPGYTACQILKIQLAVKNPRSGKILMVDMEASDTIADVKAKIEDICGLCLNLRFAGKELENDLTTDGLWNLMEQQRQELRQQQQQPSRSRSRSPRRA